MFVPTTLPLSCWPSLSLSLLLPLSYCAPLLLLSSLPVCQCDHDMLPLLLLLVRFLCQMCFKVMTVCATERDWEREWVAEPEWGGKHGWPPPPRANHLVCACVRPLILTCISARVCLPACVCVAIWVFCDLCVLRCYCCCCCFFFYHLSGCACGAAWCCCLLCCCLLLLLPSSYRTASARMNKT